MPSANLSSSFEVQQSFMSEFPSHVTKIWNLTSGHSCVNPPVPSVDEIFDTPLDTPLSQQEDKLATSLVIWLAVLRCV